MAILSNAVVNGSIRCLNKIYTQDLAVSGSSTFGALTASSVTSTGNITASGAFYSGINGLYINNKQAIRTSSTTDTWLRINEGKPFSAGVFFGSSVVRTDGELQVGNNGTYFKSNSTSTTIANLIATTSSLTTVTGSKGTFDNFNVLDTLRAKKYELDSIQSLGGEFLVCPVLYFSSSATIQISAISGTTVTAAIIDSNTINTDTVGGVQWTQYSKIKLSGKLGNTVLGTCTGTLTAKMNTNAGRINFTFTFDNASSLSVKTYASSEISDLAVMIYEKGVNSTTSYPVGIFMTGYGTNNQSYIDMYQGEDSRTKPRVRLGKLDGLDSSIKVGGVAPTGWGLYASNVFLSGAINATSGVMGGWTISDDRIYHTANTPGSTSTVLCPGGVSSSTAIGGSSGTNTWAFTVKNVFGVTSGGSLYSNSGKIGGWTMNTNSFYNGTWGTDNSAMVCTGSASAKSIGGAPATTSGWTFTSGAKYGVTKAGVLYCSDAHVTGEITATSGSIAGFTLANGVLSTNNHTAWNTNANGIYLSSSGMAGGKQGIWYLWNDGSAKIGALTLSATGVLSVPAANITGTLTAGQIATGAITADKLSASAITVGGRNLIHGSRTLTIGGGSYASGTFRASGSNGTMINETYSDSPVPGVTQGITITTTTASNEYGFVQDGAPLLADRDVTFSIWLKGSAACTARLQSYWSNTSGEAESASLTVNVTTSWKRYTLTKKTSYNHTGISISYVYSQNNSVGLKLYCIAPMMEYGNFPSDWTPNADEIGGFTIDPTAIHTTNVAVTSNADNSIALSSVDFTRTINDTSRAGLRFAIGDKFGVTGDGVIYASSANISGTITATSGTIGAANATNKITIGTNGTNASIYYGMSSLANTSSNGFYIGTDGIALGKGLFKVTNAGVLTADSGSIGPWTLTSTSLYKGNATIGTSGNGNIYLGDNGFSLSNKFVYKTSDGSLSLNVSSLKISGTAVPSTTDMNTAIANSRSASEELIVGTQTAATSQWKGTSQYITELTDGMQIKYWLPYAYSSSDYYSYTPTGGSAATGTALNLTLKGGSTTGNIPCFYSGISRITSHYAAGNILSLTYRENVTIGSVTVTAGWWADANYDSNTYDRKRYQVAIRAKSAVTGGNIIVGTPGSSNGYQHLKTGSAFDITMPILYANGGITSGSTSTNNYIAIPFTVTTTQSITLTAYQPVYIKGTLSGDTFTPVSTTPLTQAIPTSADGYHYMHLGYAYSTTAIYLEENHPIYMYFGTKFMNISEIGKTYMYYDATNGLVLSQTEVSSSNDLASANGNVRLTSSGMGIYNDNTLLANYGTDITLGQTSGTNRNIFIDTDSGVNIRKGTTVLANYGDTITINHGTSAKKALTIDSTNGVQFYELDGSTKAAQLNASGLTVSVGFIGGSSGFTIASGKMYSNNHSTIGSSVDGVYIGNDGIALGKGVFKVTNGGVLTATSATITGKITAGANSKIGPWTVTATSIYKTNATMGNATAGAAYFGDDGLSITDRFQVSSTGQLYFMNANCWGSFSSPEYDIYGENPDGGDDFLDRAVIRYDTKTHGSYQNADIYIGGETHELSSSSSGIYNGFAFRCKSDHSSNVIDAYATSFNFNPASTSSSATTSVSVHGSLSVTNGISGQLNSIRATSNKGIYITAGTDTYINPATFSGNTPSNSNGTICLGATGARFKQIWCTQSSLNSTSDRNLKENIVRFDSRFEKAYMDLIPTTYTWRNFSEDDHHDRKHWGFIAQDVEAALNQNGISNTETGFLCKDELDIPNAAGETIEYSLRYGEMIALNTHMTQKAHREIAELKDRIAYLETKLAEVTR